MTDSEKSSPKASIVKFKGSCACLRLTYECTGLPTYVQACHCRTCLKLSGGPYQVYCGVSSKAVTFFDQQDALRYEGLPRDNIGGIVYLRFSPVGERAFCVSCYSPLAMRYKNSPDAIALTLGSVDEDSLAGETVKDALKLQGHIFTSQKAWWVDVEKGGLPIYERFDGDFEQKLKSWEGKQG